MSFKPSRRILALLGTVAVCAAAGIAAWQWFAARAVIPGMVRQTEIRIAPDATGRLAELSVERGQHVRKGDILAILANPELAASVEEAKAAAAGAKADRDRVFSGIRAEEIAIAKQSVQTAETNLVLTKKAYDRTVVLAAKNFAARQQLDEITAALAKAEADLQLKRAQYDKAVAGPTVEERALADSKVVLAEATVADLQAKLDKTKLVAPVDGVVAVRVAEPGEIISPGKPVMTLEVDGGQWFAFTLREDSMLAVTMGDTLELTADDGRKFGARVTEVLPLGEFATWRAARAVGDHDLNSFRLRLEPVVQSADLKPGMSVWFVR